MGSDAVRIGSMIRHRGGGAKFQIVARKGEWYLTTELVEVGKGIRGRTEYAVYHEQRTVASVMSGVADGRFIVQRGAR